MKHIIGCPRERSDECEVVMMSCPNEFLDESFLFFFFLLLGSMSGTMINDGTDMTDQRVRAAIWQ